MSTVHTKAKALTSVIVEQIRLDMTPGYHITVARGPSIVCIKCHDDKDIAIKMADILLDIYAAGLEDELLAH